MRVGLDQLDYEIENHVRARANCVGWILMKSNKVGGGDNVGGFRLIDREGRVILGAHFDLSLADASEALRLTWC